MPLYEFECEACHKRFERIQKFSDPVPEVCPHCGRGPVKKLLSSPAIQFKGSGFYITDYPKKSSPQPGGKSSASGDAGSGGSSSADSAAKPSDGGSKSSDKSDKKD